MMKNFTNFVNVVQSRSLSMYLKLFKSTHRVAKLFIVGEINGEARLSCKIISLKSTAGSARFEKKNVV